MNNKISRITKRYSEDPARLLDVLHDIHSLKGYVDDDDVEQLAIELVLSEATINEVISFYHFFSKTPVGKFSIYLNNSITACFRGREAVKRALEESCGTTFGSVSEDGLFGLFDTSCIGMNDQEPAAIINGLVFTKLTAFRVKELVKGLKEGKPVSELIYEGTGGGNNADKDIQSMVQNNIRKGMLLLNRDYHKFEVLRKELKQHSPLEVIQIVEDSNLRGRGGAGFPTGIKWRFGRRVDGKHRVIICNADEGEPGTFKDRVMLTEFPELVFEGMVIAAYATAADIGLLYLRYEYKYLLRFLNRILGEMRTEGLLGKNAAGIKDFNFDIRIQLGAGAYICGEESALIESLEGKRGEPRDKPPFPVEKGYLNYPTIVNNVETLASAVKIIKHGAAWYKGFGVKDSLGTKLLSVSGDCRFPGIYEVEWGTSIREVIEMCGAEDVQAIQVGGPSGVLIGLKDIDNLGASNLMKWYKPSGMMVAQKFYDRKLSYSDLPTGGSIIIFDKRRDLLQDVVMNFMDFFIEESCGSCSTCRNLPSVMKQKLQKIIGGHGVRQDIDDLLSWGKMIKVSRCGLGQTAANPIVSSILNFRDLYEGHVQAMTDFDNEFDLEKSVQAANNFVGRKSVFHQN
ncbi:MAG: NAD(P)H-dependent oxidoreductase subunit E [Bacteroidales bacterium]|nr:NAD(P)H-dependent oxidoreductase subunit E [Bacteroidales bacterium]